MIENFTRKFLAVAALFALPVTIAEAAPDASAYRRVTARRAITLSDCPLFEGLTRVRVTAGGGSLQVLGQGDRDAYEFRRPFKFFACAVNDEDEYVIFAKRRANGTPVEFSLTLENFPVDTGPDCDSFPGSHIYKTVGSHHFTDIRRNTIGLILKVGARGPFPSCVEGIDSDGDTVVRLGLYQTGNGWAARYYAGIGCGSSTAYNGQKVAQIARQRTGSEELYFDFGSKCYGPVEADRCVGSKAC